MSKINNYNKILNELKIKIKSARIRASLSVNLELTAVYWEIGNSISIQEKQEGWGAKIVDTLAKDLQKEFPDMKGLSVRNLRYMREFATAYPSFLILQQPVAKSPENSKAHLEIAFLQQIVAKLPWGHNCVLLDKVKDVNERYFYAKKTVENNWSRNVLLMQIENDLYARQGKAITNFQDTLPLPQADLANETLKSPYLFEFLNIGEEAKEREIENALIKHLKKFLLELGKGFAFIGNQYNINVAGQEYYVDLLFYNTKLHCYVIFELKVGEFKPEYTGQLNFYLNAVDTQIKSIEDKPSIGILLCKTPNETVVEYALRGIEKPMGVADFELKRSLPEKLKSDLPTVKELEDELSKEMGQMDYQLKSKLDKMKSLLGELKGEELLKQKDSQIVKMIFEKVIDPIKTQTALLIRNEVEPYFTGSQFRYWTDNQVHDNSEDVRFYLIHNSSIAKFSFDLLLKGFKKAGIEAFDINTEVVFSLHDHKYQIKYGNNNQAEIHKRLYHQLLSDSEISGIAQKLLETLVDEINEKMEKLIK